MLNRLRCVLTGGLTRQVLLFVWLPLIALSYFGSLAVAASFSVEAYDWRRKAISKLLYPGYDPKCHSIASFGVTLTGLLMLPVAGYIRRQLRATATRAVDVGSFGLALGAIGLILAGLIGRRGAIRRRTEDATTRRPVVACVAHSFSGLTHTLLVFRHTASPVLVELSQSESGESLAMPRSDAKVTAIVTMLAGVTLNPFPLLGLAAIQVLLLAGIGLFLLVALVSQRAMVLEKFAPGEVIFHQGAPGRHVYVIKSGKVDILERRPDGGEELVDRLGPGDHFGDLALIRRSLPRQATVRAVTDVKVFRINPGEFVELYTSLPELREYFRDHEEPHLRKLRNCARAQRAVCISRFA